MLTCFTSPPLLSIWAISLRYCCSTTSSGGHISSCTALGSGTATCLLAGASCMATCLLSWSVTALLTLSAAADEVSRCLLAVASKHCDASALSCSTLFTSAMSAACCVRSPAPISSWPLSNLLVDASAFCLVRTDASSKATMLDLTRHEKPSCRSATSFFCSASCVSSTDAEAAPCSLNCFSALAHSAASCCCCLPSVSTDDTSLPPWLCTSPAASLAAADSSCSLSDTLLPSSLHCCRICCMAVDSCAAC
mmetsp:Transcript_27007/g.59062  ORF Transcript_27007/g.59062 Transcript_27007/m.59062 type:complete len:251 (-) Transcript_27007:2345-3097(-)